MPPEIQKEHAIETYKSLTYVGTFGLSVIASRAAQKAQSIADLHRQFNYLWDIEVSDNAFSHQLAKASCASF